MQSPQLVAERLFKRVAKNKANCLTRIYIYDLSEDEKNQKWLFVTKEDIKILPGFQNETLIAIKAPHGTTLEVPDPDEAVDYPQRRYRIVFRSTMGPIDVYLVSQFEEKFEDIQGAEPPPSYLSTSGFNENPSTTMVAEESRAKEIEMQEQNGHRMCSELNTSHDFVNGIMRIVPSDVNSDADYWLLSDADVSITDMWSNEAHHNPKLYHLIQQKCLLLLTPLPCKKVDERHPPSLPLPMW
ncbi:TRANSCRIPTION FACTOR E2F [Salix purpurea]|uniref:TRANSCRIPTION FACTOR E2F n=1 Tax=Salix purpurea TaxID=77065 RepID=A0A9Q1A6B9_SALPP|nr:TRANSCRIPTION FACTOR E2F [Salix purpurea]